MRVVSEPNPKINNGGFYHGFAGYEELKSYDPNLKSSWLFGCKIEQISANQSQNLKPTQEKSFCKNQTTEGLLYFGNLDRKITFPSSRISIYNFVKYHKIKA